MNNEEKILALLEKQGAMLAEHGKMLVEHGKMLADMRGEIKDVRGEIKDMRGEIKDIRGEISEMQTTLTRVAVTQECVVLPRLQALYEGHEALMSKIETRAPLERLEELEDEVDVQKDVIKLMRVEINELKRAK